MLLNYVTIIRLSVILLFNLCNLSINTHFLPLRPFSGEQQASRGAMFMTLDGNEKLWHTQVLEGKSRTVPQLRKTRPSHTRPQFGFIFRPSTSAAIWKVVSHENTNWFCICRRCTNSTFRSGSRFALKGIAAIRSWNSVMNAANCPKSGYDLKCCEFFLTYTWTQIVTRQTQIKILRKTKDWKMKYKNKRKKNEKGRPSWCW